MRHIMSPWPGRANYTELSGAAASLDPTHTVPPQSPATAQPRQQTPCLLEPSETHPTLPYTHTSAAQEAGVENK